MSEAVEEPDPSPEAVPTGTALVGPGGSWQDGVRGALGGLKYGARSALSARVLQGAAVELGWLTTRLAMYPLGLVGSSRPRAERLNLAGLTPAQRSLLVGDVRAAGTPILLAHGIIDNHTVFALMRRQLMRRGFSRIHTFSYSPLTLDVRSTAERMGTEIEAICEDSGSDQIHVIGHSLGGLIARYYIQRLGGHERVHTCVTAAVAAGQAGAAGQRADGRAGRARAGVPHQVRRVLQRRRPADRAATAGPDSSRRPDGE
jgi:pimeloyl-ACP methyl ester carboxylesterase